MSVLAGRKRTYLRAPDRRAQILDVAKRVFTRRGYHKASVAHICDAAKIGRGTLYQYFDNKRAVLLALLDDVAARVARSVDERTKVADIPGLHQAPREMVIAFCKRRLRELLDAIFTDEATLRLILRDARGLDGAVDRAIAVIDAHVLAAMEADLLAAQAAGLVRPGDARLMALFLLGGMEKLVLAALSGDGPIDRDEIVDLAIELELFGALSEESKH